jgi:hypothetical protein
MAGKLKPLEVARQVTPGKYPDGDGLYLIVSSPTSRNWSYRYWIKGKERWHGLGSLQDLSLKDARIKRDAARQEVRAGVDIVQTKRLAREDARAEAAVAAASTFKECAERYIKDNEAKWSKKHAAQWPSSLKQYAYPTIGDLRIAEILPSHIFELLKPIWIECIDRYSCPTRYHPGDSSKGKSQVAEGLRFRALLRTQPHRALLQ